jgi:hypothetical protein
MRQFKYYVSHPISDGGILTEEIMEKNCKAAIDFTEWLRKEFPTTVFYCPAEHEEFVHTTYKDKLLTIPQILDVDCKIIDGCDGMIIFNPKDKISAGMQVEIDYCSKIGTRMFTTNPYYLVHPTSLKAELISYFEAVEDIEDAQNL